MDRFQLVTYEENQIVFSSADDLERAYELLKNGSDVLVSWKMEGKIVSEILKPGIIAEFADAKLELKAEEVRA